TSTLFPYTTLFRSHHPPRIRESRQRSLAQGHHPQVHELDRLAASGMTEPGAVLDEKRVPDPLRVVARRRHRHFVTLPGDPAIRVAEQRAVGHLAPHLRQQT